MEKKPKGRELVAELVPVRFGTSLHFNRFGIERLDVATAVHFGLFNNDDELLATYSCVLFNEYLDRCKKEWLDDRNSKSGIGNELATLRLSHLKD